MKRFFALALIISLVGIVSACGDERGLTINGVEAASYDAGHETIEKECLMAHECEPFECACSWGDLKVQICDDGNNCLTADDCETLCKSETDYPPAGECTAPDACSTVTCNCEKGGEIKIKACMHGTCLKESDCASAVCLAD